MLVVLSIEGVLAESGAPLPIASPSVNGRMLYEGFLGASSFALFSEARDTTLVREWMLMSGYTKWVQLQTMEDEPLGTPPLAWKKERLERLMAVSSRPAFYVDADPEAVRQATGMGISSLLITNPGRFPGHQKGFRPWDELEASIEQDLLQRAEARLARNRDG